MIARIDPPEDERDAVQAKKRPAKRMVTTADRNPEVEDSRNLSAVLTPWMALGKKWHCLEKGFPEGEAPKWPLEVAERTLKILEQIAGKDALFFTQPDRFEVKPSGSEFAWAEVQTKNPESLKITLSGPDSAFDQFEFSSLEMQGPVDQGKGQGTRVTLNLKSLKHVRSRKLRTFLKSHFQQALK